MFLVSTLIEATVISFPLTVIVICVISVVFGLENILPIFIAGIFLDLLSLNLLGSHSLFFLIVLWLAGRYQQKIYLGALLYPLIFILVVSASYNYIFYRIFDIFTIVLSTLLGLMFIWFLGRLFPEKISNKKRLSI